MSGEKRTFRRAFLDLTVGFFTSLLPAKHAEFQQTAKEYEEEQESVAKKAREEELAAEEKAAKAAAKEQAKAEKRARAEEKAAAKERIAREREAAKARAAEAKRLEAEANRAAKAREEEEKRKHELKLARMKQELERYKFDSKLKQDRLQAKAKEAERQRADAEKKAKQRQKAAEEAARKQEKKAAEAKKQMIEAEKQREENYFAQNTKEVDVMDLKFTTEHMLQTSQLEYLLLRILRYYFLERNPEFSASKIIERRPRYFDDFEIKINPVIGAVRIETKDKKRKKIRVDNTLLTPFTVPDALLFQFYATNFLPKTCLLPGQYAYDADKDELGLFSFKDGLEGPKVTYRYGETKQYDSTNMKPACLDARYCLNYYFNAWQARNSKIDIPPECLEFLNYGAEHSYITNVLIRNNDVKKFEGYFPFEMQSIVPARELMHLSTLFSTNVAVAEIHQSRADGIHAALVIDGLKDDTNNELINLKYLYTRVIEWGKKNLKPFNPGQMCRFYARHIAALQQVTFQIDGVPVCFVISHRGRSMYADAEFVEKRGQTATVSFLDEPIEEVTLAYKELELPINAQFYEVMALCYFKGYHCIGLDLSIGRQPVMYTLVCDTATRVAIIGTDEDNNFYVVGRGFTHQWNPFDNKGTWSLQELVEDCEKEFTSAYTFEKTCTLWAETKQIELSAKLKFTWDKLAAMFCQKGDVPDPN